MNQSRVWTIGAVLVVFALLAGTWFLGVAPRLTDANDADVAREQAVTLNAAHRQTLVALQADHERMEEILAELAEARSVIPETHAQSTFLQSLDRLARETGVTVGNVTHSSIARYVVPDDAPADFLATANELVAAGLFVQALSITAYGSDASLLNFVSALQSNQRLTHVYQAQLLSEEGMLSNLTIRVEIFGLSESAASGAEASDAASPTPAP